VLAFLINFSFI